MTGLDLEFQRYDLSLENRRATGNQVVHEAAAAMKEAGFGIKAATVTPEGSDDVGSPNAILREEINGTVIVRTGRRIPGVNPLPGIHAPISVVRMAVDDAYGAEEWREGEGVDEVAFRTERISRGVCRGVAEFAFIQARKMRATVFGGPKWTVSPVYEGMLKERWTGPQRTTGTFATTPANRRDLRPAPHDPRRAPRHPDAQPRRRLPLGHGLADVRSIAGAESLLIALDEDENPQTVMAEAPHGTAPRSRARTSRIP